MNTVKAFLEKWIKFEIYETDEGGIYQIYAGIAKNCDEVDLSTHGFNLYFGNSESLTKNYYEYGFSTAEAFKVAVVYSLYYIAVLSAEEIVAEHIVKAFRSGKRISDTKIHKYISEGHSTDCPGKWSVYIDLRKLE